MEEEEEEEDLRSVRPSKAEVVIADGSITRCDSADVFAGTIFGISHTGNEVHTDVHLEVHRGDFDENLISVHELCKHSHRIVLDDDGSYIERKSDDMKFKAQRTSNGFRVELQRTKARPSLTARLARCVDSKQTADYPL
jgi:hypothetical protein